MVVVKIADGQYALYGHMIAVSVVPEVGDEVEAGDELGKLGSSGNSTVPHLHFGIQETADAFGSRAGRPPPRRLAGARLSSALGSAAPARFSCAGRRSG